MKCWSDTTLPSGPHAMALASRSKAAPVVVRTSHPSPTVTAVSPGASFDSETLPPLVRLTATRNPPTRSVMGAADATADRHRHCASWWLREAASCHPAPLTVEPGNGWPGGVVPAGRPDGSAWSRHLVPGA